MIIDNNTRRQALNTARTQALEFAQMATANYVKTSEDGPEVTLAIMWATVAEALKDGDPHHDGAADGDLNNLHRIGSPARLQERG